MRFTREEMDNALRVVREVVPATPQYSGALDCVVKTLRNEGVRAFYQGVVPQFYRLTGWSVVMFVTFEQLKAAVARATA